MIDYMRIIHEMEPRYHLHIKATGSSPEHLHRRYLNDFYKTMRLRSIRRIRPTYIRLVNIEDHTKHLNRTGYLYISDILSSSLQLVAEMCPTGPVDIQTHKLDTYKIMRCFDWPIKIDSIDHLTQRIITPMHPLVVMSKLLAAHPKQITSFHFGLTHTVYLTPSIDEDDYFKCDPMPFRYKRCTKFQPYKFNYND